ncbi:MAG: NUDIX domain-containing protein [Myxococcota bacterium]
MSRDPVSTWCFSLVVVKQGRRFLVVEEHTKGWYLPAGRVEAGETFADAARRETLEGAGISIDLEGIFRIEHQPHVSGTARMRVIFLARPADDRPPKRAADQESLGARWVTVEELRALPLRGEEVLWMFEEVLAGAPIYPMSVLAPEGQPLITRR